MRSCKKGGEHDEVMHRNRNNKLRDVENSSLPVCDDGECGSNALIEEQRQVLVMDQLKAELKLELQKLFWCEFDGSSNKEMNLKLS